MWDSIDVTGPTAIALNANRQVAGIVSSNANTTSIQSHSSAATSFSTTLGSDGMTVNSGTGAITMISVTGSGFLSWRLNGSQTWANNSSNLLTVNGSITNNSNSTATTLTLGGSGSGGITLASPITDNIAGTVGIVVNNTGGGVTTLSRSDNLFSGDTRLQAGQLRLGNGGALTRSTLDLATADTGTLSFGTVTAATIGGLKGTRDLVLTNTTPAAVALTVGNNNIPTTTTYEGSLSGLGSLIKNGGGMLTLTGLHTYAGATSVNGGTLLLDKSNGTAALPSTNLSLGGGALQIKGASSGTTSQTLGALTLAAGGTSRIVLDSNGGAGTTLTLSSTAPTRANATQLVIDLSSPNTTLSTTLGLTAGTQTNTQTVLPYAFVKDATGTGFATNVGGNIVRYTGAENLVALTAPTASANVKFNPTVGAPSLTTSTSPVVNSLSIDTTDAAGTLNLDGVFGFVGSNTVLMTGANNFTIQGGTSFGTSGRDTIVHNAGTGTLTINSAIQTAAVPLSKSGQGTVVLGGLNTFTNTPRILEGVLRLGAAGNGTQSPLGTAANASVVYRGGALDLGGFSLSVAKGLQLLGDGVAGGGALMNSGGAATYSGPVSLLGNASIISNGDITLSNAGTLHGVSAAGNVLTLGGTATGSSITSIINGGISGTAGNGGVIKTGTGTWTLNGVNTYSGSTVVSEGTLKIGGATTLANSSSLLVNGGTFDLNGFDETVGIVTLAGGTIAGAANTLTGSSYAVQSGTVNANLGGSTATLVKSGNGIVNLNGTSNTYAGATTINGGTLNVAGSATASAFTINSGGTLAGIGSIGALTINSGGTVSPGNSPGSLATGAQIWNDGGNYNWQVFDASGAAGTGYDTLAITGTLDLSALTGASKFNLNLWSLSGTGPDVNGAAINFDNAQNYSWVLASTTGGVTGFSSADFQINLAALNGTAGFANALNSGTFELGVVGNDLVLNYAAAIPEPSAFALIGGLAALGVASSRRRRRAA